MTRFPTIALFCAFVCAGCGTPHSAAHYTAISDGETVRVTMAEYDSAFRNPLKGFREYFMVGTDARRPEYPYPYGSLIKEYMQWNLLERNAADSVATVVAYSDHRWQGVEEQNVKVIPRVLLVWVEPWHGGWAKDPANRDDLNGWHWPEDLPEGRYILALGILDPACGRPTVRFANTNYFTGGYHPLGYVGVGESESAPALDPADFDDLRSDTTLNYKPKNDLKP